MIRCKFKVTGISGQSPAGLEVRLEAVYDSSIAEDRAYQKYTPSGSFSAFITNPAALAQIRIGAEFYVDLTPVSAPAAVDAGA